MLLGAIIIYSLTSYSSAQSKTCNSIDPTERDIFRHIFADYSSETRPVKNVSVPIEVTISLRLGAVHDLIERENTLLLDAFLHMDWHDDYVSWDSAFPNSCVDFITVSPGLLWLPDVALINSPTGMFLLTDKFGGKVIVAPNGRLHLPLGSQFVTLCEVDPTYFPFDRQVCELIFESWSLSDNKQLFKLDPTKGFVRTVDWTENQQWFLERNASRTYVKRERFNDFGYSRVIFTLVLQRKAMYYCVNVIVPGVIISVVEIATFVLPLEEVLKIHISFTCLVAYSFFQGMLINDLPRSGDSVSLLIIYINLQMAYIGFIALMGEALVFVMIRKSKCAKSRPPRWILHSAYWIGRLSFLESELTPNGEPNGIKNYSEKEIRNPSYDISTSVENVQRVNVHLSDMQPKDTTGIECIPDASISVRSDITVGKDALPTSLPKQWLFLAEVIDHLCMIVYITATFVTPVTLFTLRPKENLSI